MSSKGDLRVAHVRLGSSAFLVAVASVEEGVRIISVLAEYDNFRVEHGDDSDFSNMIELEEFDGTEWLSWESPCGCFDDPEEYLASLKPSPAQA